MYKDYFGFIEQPFSIVPNARYLFLSSRHREAMTHLQAGLGEGGGFAMLTGEVGTGKTTVSKAMLASLGDEIEAGLILNPTFSESDLLEAICDEFGIEYPEQASLKQLSQAISGYLYTNHENGKQTLLLIDEAQHLSAQVLEQLRLLTNLETDNQKLLKVLLIGQPELQLKLQTVELRQLAQRITGRYHLLPLTESEIAQYIDFRTQTAGVQVQLFSKKAVKIIARKTQGVPRLINLVCDKALQYAYYSNEKTVEASRAEKACDDVLSFQAPGAFTPAKNNSSLGPVVIGSSVLAVLAASAIYFAPEIREQAELLTDKQPEPIVVVEKTSEPLVIEVASPTFEQEIAGFYRENEISAVRTLYHLWGIDASVLDASCNLLPSHPFYCETSKGELSDILKVNRPVVLTLETDRQAFYAVLYRVDTDSVELLNSRQRIRISTENLSRLWRGEYTSLWPNKIARTLKPGDSGSSVILLDSLLAKALGEDALETKRFDDEMKARVKSFQKWQGLQADGIVGKNTLKLLDIITNKEAPELVAMGLVAEESSALQNPDARVISLDYPQLDELQPVVRNKADDTVAQEVTAQVIQEEPVPQKEVGSESKRTKELDLNSLDLSELSPELAKRVQSAFEEDSAASGLSEQNVPEPEKLTENLKKYAGQLPALNLQTHMYASDSKRRWVKINDKELSEGEWLDASIQLISISPRNIVIAFNGQQVEIPALYEWEG